MHTSTILNTLVYLDRDFVAAAYESLKGHAPMSQVTKSDGMNAGAKIPFFSGGLSAQETKTFSVSTFGMLAELMPEFEKYSHHSIPPLMDGGISRIGWVEGELSVFKVVIKERSKTHDQLSSGSSFVSSYDPEKGSETYFAIRTENGNLKIALVTTPDYFSSGVGALLRLYETVLEKVSVPVRALVRVYGATSSFQEWIGVPLLVYESKRHV
jgi:hypothetical protein